MERTHLLALQKDERRWFSQEEFDRLKALSEKQFKNAGLPSHLQMKLHDLDIDTSFSYNGQVFTITGFLKRGDGSIKVVETLAPDNKPAWFVANHDVRVVEKPAITKTPALTKEQLQSRAEMLDSI